MNFKIRSSGFACLLFFACLCVSAHAQSSTGGASTSSTGSGSGSTGTASSTAGTGGGGGSSLQSESKVLIFQSMSECISDLVAKMHHTVTTTASGSKPAFVLNLPFLPDDAASCWEFKRQFLFLDQSLAALKPSLSLGPYPGHYALYTKALPDLERIDANIQKLAQTYKEIKFAGAAASTTTPAAATPNISELGGIGASATQIGVIASTISGLLAIAQSFHSTISTSEGSISLDQTTVNSLVVNELINRGYQVYDFSQFYISDDSYNKVVPALALEKQNIMELMVTLTGDITTLDAGLVPILSATPLPSVKDAKGNLPPSPDTEIQKYLSFYSQIQKESDAKHLTESSTKQLTQQEEDMVKADQATLTDLQKAFPAAIDWATEYSSYSAAVTNNKNVQGVLKAANTFAQTVLGVIAPKLPLASDTASNNNPGGTNTTLSVALPDGKMVTASLPSSGNSTNTGSQSQGASGQSSSVPQASPINYIEKFSLLEHDLDLMKDKHMKIIAAHVIVGDSTQTHVGREILEDYVALSNRAVIEMQVFDPLRGNYIYSDHSESDHQYVYFPSRIRDGAENKWKDRDFLAHPRDVPYNNLEWFSRADWAENEASTTRRPILVYYFNSDLRPLTHDPDERVFADSDFKTFAAQHLVLLLCDANSNKNHPPKDLAQPDFGHSTSPRLELFSCDGKQDLGRVKFDPQSGDDVDSLLDAIQDLMPTKRR
jgi:hypothetical protein